ADHRRGSAEPAVEGYRTTAVGAAGPRLLDANDPGAVVDRVEPDAINLFPDRGTAGGARPGSDRPGHTGLATPAGAVSALRPRVDRVHAAVLRDPELSGPLARRSARGGRGGGGDRDREDRFFVLYRGNVQLPDRLRRAGDDPHLSLMDVRLLDGGIAG